MVDKRIPWNKGMKGLKYNRDNSYLKEHGRRLGLSNLGKVSKKKNMSNGSITSEGYKTFVFNGKKIKEQHLIWCRTYGNLPFIPTGFIIHHLDGDKLNNIENNLILLQKEDHNNLHWDIRHREALTFLSR